MSGKERRGLVGGEENERKREERIGGRRGE